MIPTRRRLVAAAALVTFGVAGVSACAGADNPDRGNTQDSGNGTSSSAESSESSGPPEPVASIDSLTGNTTAVRLDSGFTSALSALELTPGVVGDARLQNGSLVFPITGGNVTYFEPGTVSPYVQGQIQHEGSGLSLSGGGKRVELTNLNVDPGASRVYGDVTVGGRVMTTDAYLLTLDGRTLQPLQNANGTVVLQGTRVEISPTAAALLNQTFATQEVKGGLLVGTATITLATTPGE